MSWLTELLRRPAIAWWDVLDIAIVSIMVHELLLLIRGTRAVQMALSGGFLIGLFFLSQWLQLETVNWPHSKPRRGIRRLRHHRALQADIRALLAHLAAPVLSTIGRAMRDDDRGAGRDGRKSGLTPHRRDHRDRTADRPAQLHEGGIRSTRSSRTT